MTLNFNTQPYFDDFDDNKNYHKILFKPGVSVQGRELTQIQSILQDQIGKFGKFVLSDGSKVTGGRYFSDTNAISLKLSNTASIDLPTSIQNLTGTYVVGETSKCFGYVSNADLTNYYITVKPLSTQEVYNFTSGETLRFFSSKLLASSYIHNSSVSSDLTYVVVLDTDNSTSVSGVYGVKNSNSFTINTYSIEEGDVLTIEASHNPYDTYVVTEVTTNGTVTVHKPLDEDYNNVTVTRTKYASRYVMEVSFDSGVYFTNNIFVKALEQTIIPNIKTQYPSCVIGYQVVETTVDFVDDSSLLDPAQGSFNYTAPGADRYKIYLELVSKPFVNGTIENLTTAKFIELLRIKNGNIVSDTTGPQLGAIESVLARQMYDHAGNFIVKDFNLSFHNSDFKDNVDTIQAELSTGKAYVFGYEYNHKSPSFFTIDKGRDKTSLTNQEMITYYGNHISVSDISGDFLNCQDAPKIELHSTTANSANANTLIATAYVRNIRQQSSSEYYLNLYNISSSDISAAKSVIRTSNNYSTLSFSANTVLSNNVLPVVDSTYNSLIYQLPKNYVSNISNVQFTTDVFETKTVISNSLTISTGSLNRLFPGGTGTLPSDIKKSNFIIVANVTNGAYTKGQYINLDDVTISITQGLTEYSATFTFNSGYSGSIGIKYALEIIDATPKTKTEVLNAVQSVQAKVSPSSLGIADVFNIKGIYYSDFSENPGANLIYIGNWSSGTNYSKYNVVLFGNNLFVSLIDSNTNNQPENGVNWSKLQDVTSKYIFNNGQTEYMYDHAYIQAKNHIDQKQVFVIFDYYTHSLSGDYINFSSYPTQYSKIPTNTINNKIYDMKNYVDFRPRRVNASKTLQFDSYFIPSTAFSGFMYDMQYYLGRIDKLILTDTKQFQWLRGIPSYTNYIPPADVSNAMTIATIKINPFTSSDSDISVTYKRHRRYTMDDIGNLDKRLSNVEYYTSLNMVEKDILSRNIYDTTTGQRMTNGFVVDPFVGFGTMSLSDNYQNSVDISLGYKNCSLDLKNQVLRPSFKAKTFAPLPINLDDFSEKENIISFKYTEEEFTNQLISSSTINCNPFDVISYSGNLSLSPQADNFVDKEIKPIINNISDDLDALNAAKSLPGLVYDDWNLFYSTNEYTIDKAYEKTTITTQNATNQVVYDVTAALVTLEDKTVELSNNIIPYARSIPVKFEASGLAPLSKMYVYIQGKLVNGYVTPKTNPFNSIQQIVITDRGTGYYPSNTSISLVGANTRIAYISPEVTNGILSATEITERGAGYGSSNNTITPIVVGSGTSANVTISTTPALGSDLYSDQYGFCSGTVFIPNDDTLKFASGELHVLICDNPNYDFNNCISKAEATYFASSRKVVTQETITSIRKPYITIAGKNDTPAPTLGASIVVPVDKSYTVRDDINSVAYSNFKTGSITIPVFLNKKPNSSVTVTCSNASLDQTAKATYSITPSSLTFSTSDYSTAKNFTINYDLGDRTSFNVDTQLFSYLEFYGDSTDTGYNYAGSKPASSWKSTTPITGVSVCNLKPVSKALPTQQVAGIACSSIAARSGTGQCEFVGTFSGDMLPDYFPITVTVAAANSSVCTVSGIYPPNSSTLSQTNTFTVTKATDLTNFRVQLTYTDVGAASTTITATTSSTASYWNGVSGSTTFTHTATTPTISAAITVQPSSSTRKTTEDGGTTIVLLHLSKQPNSNVTITATSSDTTEGVISGTNTLTFTTSNWATDQSITVAGVNDSLVDGDIDYNLNLTASSSDTAWSSVTTAVPITNVDKTVAPPANVDGSILAVGQGANPWTDTNQGTYTILVSLSKQPTSTITVTSSSDNSFAGTVITGDILTFTTSNWNVQQKVVVRGVNSGTADTNYNVNFIAGALGTPKYTSASVSLINKYIKPSNYTKLRVVSTKTYKAVSKIDPASWVPSFNISGITYVGKNACETGTATSGSVSTNSTTNGQGIANFSWYINGIQGVPVDNKPDGVVTFTFDLTFDVSDTILADNYSFDGTGSALNLVKKYWTPSACYQNLSSVNNYGSATQQQGYIINSSSYGSTNFRMWMFEKQIPPYNTSTGQGWKASNPVHQFGNAEARLVFDGFIPNVTSYSTFGLSIVETTIDTTYEDVYDGVSNTVIASNYVSSSAPSSRTIVPYFFATQQTFPWNAEIKATLYDWLKSFPALVSSPTFGATGFTNIVKYWDTIPYNTL